MDKGKGHHHSSGGGGSQNQNSQSAASKRDELYQELERAARQGDNDELQNIIEKCQDKNQLQIADLNKALLSAVQGCSSSKIDEHSEIIAQLVANGAQIDYEEKQSGKTSLMIACEKGYIELVNEILEKEAMVNHKDQHNKTPLLYAIDNQAENLDVVNVLILKNADLNIISFDGLSPLLTAVTRHHRRIINLLIEKGANVYDKYQRSGNTIIHTACEHADLESIKVILKHPKSLDLLNTQNKHKETPLQMAQRLKDKGQDFQQTFLHLKHISDDREAQASQASEKLLKEEQSHPSSSQTHNNQQDSISATQTQTNTISQQSMQQTSAKSHGGNNQSKKDSQQSQVNASQSSKKNNNKGGQGQESQQVSGKSQTQQQQVNSNSGVGQQSIKKVQKLENTSVWEDTSAILIPQSKQLQGQGQGKKQGNKSQSTTQGQNQGQTQDSQSQVQSQQQSNAKGGKTGQKHASKNQQAQNQPSDKTQVNMSLPFTATQTLGNNLAVQEKGQGISPMKNSPQQVSEQQKGQQSNKGGNQSQKQNQGKGGKNAEQKGDLSSQNQNMQLQNVSGSANNNKLNQQLNNSQQNNNTKAGGQGVNQGAQIKSQSQSNQQNSASFQNQIQQNTNQPQSSSGNQKQQSSSTTQEHPPTQRMQKSSHSTQKLHQQQQSQQVQAQAQSSTNAPQSKSKASAQGTQQHPQTNNAAAGGVVLLNTNSGTPQQQPGSNNNNSRGTYGSNMANQSSSDEHSPMHTGDVTNNPAGNMSQSNTASMQQQLNMLNNAQQQMQASQQFPGNQAALLQLINQVPLNASQQHAFGAAAQNQGTTNILGVHQHPHNLNNFSGQNPQQLAPFMATGRFPGTQSHSNAPQMYLDQQHLVGAAAGVVGGQPSQSFAQSQQQNQNQQNANHQFFQLGTVTQVKHHANGAATQQPNSQSTSSTGGSQATGAGQGNHQGRSQQNKGMIHSMQGQATDLNVAGSQIVDGHHTFVGGPQSNFQTPQFQYNASMLSQGLVGSTAASNSNQFIPSANSAFSAVGLGTQQNLSQSNPSSQSQTHSQHQNSSQPDLHQLAQHSNQPQTNASQTTQLQTASIAQANSFMHDGCQSIQGSQQQQTQGAAQHQALYNQAYGQSNYECLMTQGYHTQINVDNHYDKDNKNREPVTLELDLVDEKDKQIFILEQEKVILQKELSDVKYDLNHLNLINREHLSYYKQAYEIFQRTNEQVIESIKLLNSSEEGNKKLKDENQKLRSKLSKNNEHNKVLQYRLDQFKIQLISIMNELTKQLPKLQDSISDKGVIKKKDVDDFEDMMKNSQNFLNDILNNTENSKYLNPGQDQQLGISSSTSPRSNRSNQSQQLMLNQSQNPYLTQQQLLTQQMPYGPQLMQNQAVGAHGQVSAQAIQPLHYQDESQLSTKVSAVVSNESIYEQTLECLKNQGYSFCWHREAIQTKLHYEIVEFHNIVQEILKDLKPYQNHLIQMITDVVKQSIPNAQVKVYGSHATDLCLHWSDIDFVIIPPKQGEGASGMGNQQQAQNILGSVAAELTRQSQMTNKWVHQVNYLETASMPVVKVICSFTGVNNTAFSHIENSRFKSIIERQFSIDITQNTDDNNALECVKLVKGYLQESDIVKPMILVLKQMLKVSRLNDPYTGGISSYALLLMIVAFLQSKGLMKKMDNQTNLGKILLEFLMFYGNGFNQSAQGIQALKPNSEMEKAIFYQLQAPETFNLFTPGCVQISDPLNPSNNVGKSSFQFDQVCRLFYLACNCALYSIDCDCHSPQKLQFLSQGQTQQAQAPQGPLTNSANQSVGNTAHVVQGTSQQQQDSSQVHNSQQQQQQNSFMSVNLVNNIDINNVHSQLMSKVNQAQNNNDNNQFIMSMINNLKNNLTPQQQQAQQQQASAQSNAGSTTSQTTASNANASTSGQSKGNTASANQQSLVQGDTNTTSDDRQAQDVSNQANSTSQAQTLVPSQAVQNTLIQLNGGQMLMYNPGLHQLNCFEKQSVINKIMFGPISQNHAEVLNQSLIDYR